MIGNAKTAARLLGLPYLPITPTFPLLGPARRCVPLPSKWLIEFGEPIETASYGPAAADDPMLVFNLTDQVRETIQHSLYQLLLSASRQLTERFRGPATCAPTEALGREAARGAQRTRDRSQPRLRSEASPGELVAPAQGERAADQAAGSAARRRVGTAIFAALRPVRKSRIAQPRRGRCRAARCRG